MQKQNTQIFICLKIKQKNSKQNDKSVNIQKEDNERILNFRLYQRTTESRYRMKQLRMIDVFLLIVPVISYYQVLLFFCQNNLN